MPRPEILTRQKDPSCYKDAAARAKTGTKKGSPKPFQKEDSSKKQEATSSTESLIMASPILITQDAVDAMNVSSLTPRHESSVEKDVRMATPDSGEMVQKALETTSQAVDTLIAKTGNAIDLAFEKTKAVMGIS